MGLWEPMSLTQVRPIHLGCMGMKLKVSKPSSSIGLFKGFDTANNEIENERSYND